VRICNSFSLFLYSSATTHWRRRRRRRRRRKCECFAGNTSQKAFWKMWPDITNGRIESFWMNNLSIDGCFGWN
jgi:hypothetical protein